MPATAQVTTNRVLLLRPMFAVGSSFVKVDRQLLERHFTVTPFAAEPGDRLLFLRLLKALREQDLCYVWFADAHAYAAVKACRLLRKPCLLVPGQYELADYPQAGYGLRHESKSRWRRGMYALRHATKVLAVSQFHEGLIREQGVPQERLAVIPHGFEVSLFDLRPVGEKQPGTVVTTSHLGTPQRLWIKGLETFARAAALVPEAQFTIIGDYSPQTAEQLQSLAEGRLQLTGGLPFERVLDVLTRTQVYAQLSATESFGCALAEAMLGECIPVVTNRGALPEVVGDLGFEVEYGDAEGTAAAIRKAFGATHGAQCRRRIQELYPLERREQALLEAVEQHVDEYTPVVGGTR